MQNLHVNTEPCWRLALVCFSLCYAKLTLYALQKGADINHAGSCLQTGVCVCVCVCQGREMNRRDAKPCLSVLLCGCGSKQMIIAAGRQRGCGFAARAFQALAALFQALSRLFLSEAGGPARFLRERGRVSLIMHAESPRREKSSCDNLFTWGYGEYVSLVSPPRKNIDWKRVCVLAIFDF